MKFNLVNDNKLQIIISKEDMRQRNLHKWDMLPHNPVAQKMFQEILEEAREACGFDVGQDTQLMIEAYPMTGESLLVTVTKISSGRHKLPFDLDMDEIGHALMEELLQDNSDSFPEKVTDDLVYQFAQLEDVIRLAAVLYPRYDGPSQLMRYQDRYYLVFPEGDELDETLHGLLEEYGAWVDTAAVFFAEHGQVVMAERALEILASL